MKSERQIISEVLDRLLEKDDPQAGTGTATTLILKGLKERRAYVASEIAQQDKH